MPKTIYWNDREHPLLWYGEPPHPIHGRILTIENYCKWYSIYTIDSKGKIKKLHYSWRRKYEEENKGHCAWCDHKPSPLFCKWLTHQKTKFTWQLEAIELILGRWWLGSCYEGYLSFTSQELKQIMDDLVCY